MLEKDVWFILERISNVAKTYNDKLQIHIRKYNRFDTQLSPTKKGVTLSLSRWLMLENREAVVFINFTVKRSQKKTKKTYI